VSKQKAVLRKATFVGLALALLMVLAAGTALAQQAQFRFGFGTLATLIPGVVGQPVTNEMHDVRGNAIQQTTTGLMFWRKANNITSFTDGFRTWLLGPQGLQGRLNTDRFPWESPPRFESPSLFAFPGNWNNVPERTIPLFYPAQTSLQWVLSPAHAGAAAVAAGTSCQACHAGQEAMLGARLVNHPTLEPSPIPGKDPVVNLSVRAAYDDQHLYMRYEWESERPIVVHQLWRYDGERWVAWGGFRPDAPARGITPHYEDRLAVLVDDRNHPVDDGANWGFAQAGCWITCHSSMRAMEEEPTAAEVQAHPYLGGLLRVADVRKYLLTTRTADSPAAGWAQLKPVEVVQSQLAMGQFLDLWMWRAARSGPIGYGDDNFVLDYRNADQGRSPFANPAQPQWMYDAARTGYNAVPESEWDWTLDRNPLIQGVNAVPFDPNARFNVGDLLPRQVLQTPDGSRADLLFNSRWENGRWIVEMRRALNTGRPDDKVFAPGQVYNVGLAIFDDHVSNRRHHVSFEKTLGFGVAADIQAVRIGQ
jgi:hypothetical protein